MSGAERAWVQQQEEDRVNGKKVMFETGGSKMRAFDDLSDHTNLGFIQQRLKNLSQPNEPNSDNSMSSGSGNYEGEDRDKNVQSDDSDMQMI